MVVDGEVWWLCEGHDGVLCWDVCCTLLVLCNPKRNQIYD